MSWYIKHYNELTKADLYSILKLRSEVFVVEQDCVYNDLDSLDFDAYHIYKKESGNVIAYARVLPAGSRFVEMSIGRVLVSFDYRGKRLGVALMQNAIEFIQNTFGVNQIRISAQEYLKQFYVDLGFVPNSDIYLEDGIRHLEMVLKRISI